jgi:putative membrane protein
MDRPVRAVVPVLSAALLIAACSTNDHPYAHESMPHQTAAERLYGTTGGPASAPAPPVMSATEPTVVAPATPMTVPQTVSRLAPSDASFTQDAMSSSAAEIELARIAFVRAQSPDVRAFARQMLIDHRAMAITLDNFALTRGYVVPWQIPPEAANAIDRLRTIDTSSFDRAYMDEMVTGHEDAVAKFETQAASGRETASIANEALPTVRHHLEMARDLQARL